MSEDKIKKLKEQYINKKRESDTIKIKLDSMYSELKNKFGLKTVDDAKKLVDKNILELNEIIKKRDNLILEVENKLNEYE